MLRPVTSQEIGWLAVVLVRLSMRVNCTVGLDGGQPAAEDEQPDNVFQVRQISVIPSLFASDQPPLPRQQRANLFCVPAVLGLCSGCQDGASINRLHRLKLITI